MHRDLDAIRAGIARIEAENAQRSREAAERRARRRPLSRSALSNRQRARMAKVVADAYSSEHRPLPGSPRDVRLRILGMSLRELARRAGVSHNTVDRAERAFEAGDPDAVRGPYLRRLADGIERATGRRTKIDDVRAPRDGR